MPDKDVEKEKPQKSSEKERSLEKRLFAAQRDLDTELKDDELIGAMRQCLHKNQLSCVMERWWVVQNSQPEIETVVFIVFSLRFGTYESEVSEVSFLRSEMKTINGILDYAWRTYLRGIFAMPVRLPHFVTPEASKGTQVVPPKEPPTNVADILDQTPPRQEPESVSLPPGPIAVRPRTNEELIASLNRENE